MTIAKLKVFSHEIHEIFGDELEALAAIKQLKYFYNLPLGQLFCALALLYKPMCPLALKMILTTRGNET
jgi:hypothetical protein